MKLSTVAAAVTLALAAVAVPSAAEAAPYSIDHRIGAYLDPVRQCSGDWTSYQVDLRNDTGRARWFRTTEVVNGVKVSDSRWLVPRHQTTAVMFYVTSGHSESVTVTRFGEILTHRRLTGICY